MRCPKASTYNAILFEDDEVVHIVPFYVDKGHFSIPIAKLLPKRLIEQISVDVIVKQNCDDFGIEYKQLLVMQQKHWMNKLILSMLIGIIVCVIGVILYLISAPKWIGIGVMAAGLAVLLMAVCYHRMFKPKQQSEYLLF